MTSMFSGCSSLSSLPDISKWNPNYNTDIIYMFKGYSSLISLPDISKWNIIKIIITRSPEDAYHIWILI